MEKEMNVHLFEVLFSSVDLYLSTFPIKKKDF